MISFKENSFTYLISTHHIYFRFYIKMMVPYSYADHDTTLYLKVSLILIYVLSDLIFDLYRFRIGAICERATFESF